MVVHKSCYVFSCELVCADGDRMTDDNGERK